MIVRFVLNGAPVEVEAPADRRAVDLLREDLGLTGTKEGCGAGECGACTILADGAPRLSCLMLAAQLDGRDVVTIEGLGAAEAPHPVQAALAEHGAVQCGFCTPGVALSAAALLARGPVPDRQALREGLSGHLCRCTGYQKIIDAVEAAGWAMQAAGRPPRPAPREPGALSGTGGQAGQGGAAAPAACARSSEPAAGPGGRSSGRVLLPASLDELWAILDGEPDCALMAGGTDLLVRRRAGRPCGEPLVCLERIADLRRIEAADGWLRLGAGAPLAACLASPPVAAAAPVLAQALRRMAAPQVRHMGTVGGNLCTASPAGDCLPPLHVLGAEVVLRSREAERVLPVADFILGPGRTALRPGEILLETRFPSADRFQVQHFEKVGQRNAQAIAMLSLAALVRLNGRGAAEEVRLALGGVGPVVVRPREAEAALLGRRLTLAALRRAAELVRAAVSPIDDIRASADYRRQVAGNLLLRLAAL